jgi:hypothetical protein
VDGDVISIWASAFIPCSSFIFPDIDGFSVWSGDNRSTATIDGSSRVWHSVKIDLNPWRDLEISNESGGGITQVTSRYFLFGPKRHRSARVPKPSLARIRTLLNGKTEVVLSASAGNPLVPLAKHLEYDYRILFDHKSDAVHVTGSRSAFPAFDLIIQDEAIFTHVPRGFKNTPFALYCRKERVDITLNRKAFHAHS